VALGVFFPKRVFDAETTTPPFSLLLHQVREEMLGEGDSCVRQVNCLWVEKKKKSKEVGAKTSIPRKTLIELEKGPGH